MKRDYEIGYRKPPKATQFKPGQSGNPNGRPRAGTIALNSSLGFHLLSVAKMKVRVLKEGKATNVSMLEALTLVQAEQGVKGKRLQAAAFMKDAMALEAALKQDAADCYSFWTQWRTTHQGAPLNWPRTQGVTPLLPHPRDVHINPMTLDVSFIGPMSLDELPLFDAVVVLTEILLVDAEHHLRTVGAPDAKHRELLGAAMITYGYAAPSLGGQSPDEAVGAARFRLAGLIMDTKAMTTAELTKRRLELIAQFDQARQMFALPKRRRAQKGRGALAELAGTKLPKPRLQRP